MADLFIPIILGTAREGRNSERVAKYVLKQAEKDGRFSTELLDVRDYVNRPQSTMAVDGPMGKKWKETMSRADGLIIVSPEYNHGYPGELKLMLDDLREEYHRKPLALCGVSTSAIGGARVVEQLRTVAIDLQMTNLRNAVYFISVQNLFDEKGEMKDASYEARVKTVLDELVWYAEALKPVREKKTA